MTRRLAHLGHLGRRFVGSWSHRPPAPADVAWVEGILEAPERELWSRMSVADRRHSIDVAQRFAARRRHATRAELAGALLHDVGKIEAGLGTTMRVVATVVGPRTIRFRCYHEHESIGARLATAAGCEAATVALIEGHGPAGADLRQADAI